MQLSWDLFRVKNQNSKVAFQDLCKALFARRIGAHVSELVEYHNQKGVEVEPIKIGSGYQSFQAKFSDKDEVLWAEFRKSLEKTIEEKPGAYSGLTIVINYTNGAPSQNNSSRKDIGELGLKNGITVEWVIGQTILDLLDEEANADLRKKYFGGGQDLNIILPRSEPEKSLAALKYQAQTVKFIGRNKELNQLIEFVESEAKVQWWIIGGKGGSGKSRLALELCNKYDRKGWICGFYDPEFPYDLEGWDPEKPHLIIYDYVLGQEQVAVNLLTSGIRLQINKNLSFPIRILLLERDADSVLKELVNKPTFGSSLESQLYKKSPLFLAELSSKKIKASLKEIAHFFGLSDAQSEEIFDFVEANILSRKLLVCHLYCLYTYQYQSTNFPLNLDSLICSLVERERKHWIEKKLIDKEQERYLILATLLGGIDLSKPGEFSPDATNFLKQFDFPEQYGIVVGQSAENFLAPLSHDIVSELYVLDGLKPINPLNTEVFNTTIFRALGINNGKALLPFFTRAANDYPNHPTLKQVLRPFTNFEPGFSVWLLILANTIDKIDAPLTEKLNLLIQIHDGLMQQPSVLPKYLGILEGLFLRLLSHTSGLEDLKYWVGEYRIIELVLDKIDVLPDPQTNSSPIPLVGISEDLLLKPKDYCQHVLLAFSSLAEEHKEAFVWHELFDAYFHSLLHQLSSRQANLSDIHTRLREMVCVFTKGWEPGLELVFENVMAGMFQWGYLNKMPEIAADITLWMLQELESRTIHESLAGCYAAATLILSETLRNFDSKKRIVERFKSTFSEHVNSNEYLSSKFIASTVALMYGFRCKSDFEYALQLNQRAFELTKKYPTHENTLNLARGTVQLSNYKGDYNPTNDREVILQRCEKIAKLYGSSSVEIIQKILEAFEDQYQNESLQSRPNELTNLFNRVIELIFNFQNCKFEKQLYLGRLVMTEFDYRLKIEDLSSLYTLGDNVARLQAIELFELGYVWSGDGVGTKLFNKWSIAKNRSDYSLARSLAGVADHWNKTLLDNTYVKNLFSHMVEETRFFNHN